MGFSPPARLLPRSDSWRSLFIPGGTVDLSRASHEALTRDAAVFRRDLVTRGYVVPAGARTEQVYAAVRDDISRRLSTVCGGWPDSEFARLVDDVTRTAINHLRVEQL